MFDNVVPSNAANSPGRTKHHVLDTEPVTQELSKSPLWNDQSRDDEYKSEVAKISDKIIFWGPIKNYGAGFLSQSGIMALLVGKQSHFKGVESMFCDSDGDVRYQSY